MSKGKKKTGFRKQNGQQNNNGNQGGNVLRNYDSPNTNNNQKPANVDNPIQDKDSRKPPLPAAKNIGEVSEPKPSTANLEADNKTVAIGKIDNETVKEEDKDMCPIKKNIDMTDIIEKIDDAKEDVKDWIDITADTLIIKIPTKVEERIGDRLKNIVNANNQNLNHIGRLYDDLGKVNNKVDRTKDAINSVKEDTCKDVERGLNNLKAELKGENKRQFEEIKQKVNNLPARINEIQEAVDSQVDGIKKSVKNISNDVGTVLGKAKAIDDGLAAVKEAMESKDFTVRTKLPTITKDEEAMAQMGEYAHSLIDQLTLAAVNFARKRQDIEGIEKERRQHQEVLQKTKIDAIAEGKEIGRNELIMKILEKIDDKNALMEAQNGIEGVLASLLLNEGVEMRYRVDEIIELDMQSLPKYTDYISIPDLDRVLESGAVKITARAVIFDGKILAKAKCVPTLSKARAEAKAKAEAEAKAKAEAEAKAKAEAEAKAKAEAEAKAKAEAEAKAKTEAEAKAKTEAERHEEVINRKELDNTGK